MSVSVPTFGGEILPVRGVPWASLPRGSWAERRISLSAFCYLSSDLAGALNQHSQPADKLHDPLLMNEFPEVIEQSAHGIPNG